MFEIFGEMDTAEEINAKAEGLRNKGDRENLLKLAAENGIDAEAARMYFDGALEAFCDVATAAIGKIEAEAAGINPIPAELMSDWVEYIKASCFEDGELARAVRRKGKSLKGCMGALLKWSYDARYAVDGDIVKAAGLGSRRVDMGIPGMGRAKKLIKEYYMDPGVKGL